ncbi:hypothetical protein CLM62_23285 [Streptomyces sp. SA15]|uniref:hypothetical protein n=1 Tax=Streptomyces sp. SA15 TaxID=934019 RepID=UPI000BAE85C5|nr:hypothetical protein [Streptomyces sp. SA15]PAZ13621.1 hypothetical protein CLM62_23285 [Streptomyces sp. SA15]
MTHVADYEGDPRRRPLHCDEVQTLFDAADGWVEQIAGTLFGLDAVRPGETELGPVCSACYRRIRTARCGMRRCPKTPQFGPFGALNVRVGKSSRGGQFLLSHRQDA